MSETPRTSPLPPVFKVWNSLLSFPGRKDLGNAEAGHSYTSIEELKNIWIPHSIRMKLTKNKELDVCNWNESDEVMRSLALLGSKVHQARSRAERGNC